MAFILLLMLIQTLVVWARADNDNCFAADTPGEAVADAIELYILNEDMNVLDFGPVSMLSVEYGEGETCIYPGRTISSSTALFAPYVELKDDSPDSNGDNNVLIMLDPDFPGSPRNEQFLHWLVCGISGGDVSSGTTKKRYLPPRPVPLTGVHRYTFILFGNCNTPCEILDRATFSTDEFAENCEAVLATNFFLAGSKPAAGLPGI